MGRAGRGPLWRRAHGLRTESWTIPTKAEPFYNRDMSRAFVKQADEAESVVDLPDRPVSPGPNLVTKRGLALVEGEIARLRAALAEAHTAEDRAAIAEASRDLRYWTARRNTAQVVDPGDDTSHVRFGLRVTITRDDGRSQSFRIVGQDEADPAQGLLPYDSPLGRALMGARVGDVVAAGPNEVEVVAIEAVPDPH
jgi:transcription elongation GreA/GreB family factor